jgi:UDP-2,3-diacylglucosamine hydrolase
MLENITLKNGQKVYFASDFHLGAPDLVQSHLREKKINAWLDSIKGDAAAIFLMGDVFDFWFEYKHVVPKGFVRLLGKLAELRDQQIPIYIFTGNHDMWMRDYFEKELGIPVYRNPKSFKINKSWLQIGHGDGLGPGDRTYKLLKVIFESRISRWLFRWLHPDIGVAIAKAWSGRSRITNVKKGEDHFKGEENEWLMGYCKAEEQKQHHDFYIFGHRHLPLDLAINENSRYINLGEWVNYNSYAVCEGETCKLLYFDATKSVADASLNT